MDSYKSSTIHTSAGEPPSSVSKPTPRAKQVAARPVAKGKLLRPGGPGGGPSKLSAAARKPAPAPQPLPQATQPATQSRIVPQPVAAIATAAATHSRNESTSSVRAPPPPPPAAAPKKPTAKVLYDFSSDRANELTIRTGEIVQIVSKEGNGTLSPIIRRNPECQTNIFTGWWLCMNMTTSTQGWTPEAYLEEQVAPTPKPAPPPPPAAPRATPSPVPNGAGAVAAAKSKPAPPAPPAKRPNMAGRKPAPPPAPRDSTLSMASGDSSGASGRGTPNSTSNASLAGGLAEALRARQSAMQGKHDDDDDW